MFDPDAFAQTTIDTPMSTRYEPIPEIEYQAVVGEAKPKSTPNGNALIEVRWELDAPDDDRAHNKRVKQTIWLDIDQNGMLDCSKGKNVPLGRLREALGQNVGTWNPSMLVGAVGIVFVKDDPPKEEGGQIYSKVTQVRAA